MDGNSGVFIGIRSSLGGNCVLLVGHGASGDDIAVLDDDRSVAEDEIHGAVDINFAVELAERVDI